jgi:hypothetical protein
MGGGGDASHGGGGSAAAALAALRGLWGLVAARHTQPPRGPLLAWLFDVERVERVERGERGGEAAAAAAAGNLSSPPSPSSCASSPSSPTAAWALSQAASRLLVDRRGWWYKQVLLAAPNGFSLAAGSAAASPGETRSATGSGMGGDVGGGLDAMGSASADRLAAVADACAAGHGDGRWRTAALGPAASGGHGSARSGGGGGSGGWGGGGGKRTPPSVLAPCRQGGALEVALDKGFSLSAPVAWCAAPL